MIFCNYLCITSEPLREHARFSFHSATLLWELWHGSSVLAHELVAEEKLGCLVAPQ